MAANLIYRTATQVPPSTTQVKTSPLTHEEMDGNLKSLDAAIDIVSNDLDALPTDELTLTNKTLTNPVINGGASGTTSGKLGYNSGNITFGTGTEQKTIASKEDLAAPSGSALVGYDGGTAQDVLDSAKPMQSYTALRAYTGRATSVRITTPGIHGHFYYDAGDTTTEDNGGTVIVDASGRRWKRLFSGSVSVKWFGAKGDGVTNDATTIKSAIMYGNEDGQKLVFPSGAYLINTLLSDSSLASAIWEAQGDVQFICSQSISLSSPSQSLVLTENTVPWQNYIQVADTYGCEVGDIIYLAANVIVETYRNESIKRTVARIEAITENTITLDSKLVFRFSTTDPGISVSYYKGRKVELNGFKFITKTGATGARALTLTGIADCVGHRNCEFETESHENGSLDCELIQMSINVNPENAKYKNARYGAMRQTTRNCGLNGAYGYKLRHLTYPSYWSMDGVWRGITTESCIAGLDCHSSFTQNCYDSKTISDLETSNWRSCGSVLRNVRLSLKDSTTAASQTGILTAPQAWKSEYEYLLNAFDTVWRNVYVEFLSGVAPASGRLLTHGPGRLFDVEIESNLIGLNLSSAGNTGGSGTTVIVKSDSIQLAPTTSTFIRSNLTLRNSKNELDFTFTEGKYVLFPYPFGVTINPGKRKLNAKGTVYKGVKSSGEEEITLRVYDSLDPFANSFFKANAIVGKLDVYVKCYSAVSTRYDYGHFQWTWAHSFSGSTAFRGEPQERIIVDAPGQSGDGLAFTLVSAVKSPAPANSGYRADQYVDVTFLLNWGFSGDIELDYALEITQV